MNDRHSRRARWLGLLALTILLPAPAFGAGEREAFMTDTHVFRRILAELKFEPLKSFAELKGEVQSHTLLVVLGRMECLKDLPGGVNGLDVFLRKGGAVLLAGDQTPSSLELKAALRKNAGVRLERRDFFWVRNHRDFFRDLEQCPFLVPLPVEDSQAPQLFSSPGQRDALKVATNIPAYLEIQGRLPSGIYSLAKLPREVMNGPPAPFILAPPERLFAVGGQVGDGRLLLLADHSIFINEMLLPTDNDNIEFTYRCLEWLKKTSSGMERDRALVVLDGKIQSNFKPILKELPITPPEQAIVQAINEQVAHLEDRDIPNKLVNGWIDDALGRDADRPLRWLLYGCALALVLYGIYRLGFGARHQPEPALPPLDETVASHIPEGPLVERRQRALLRGGNLWESAHVLARQCFAAAGVAAPSGSCPRVHSRGSWWQRWCLAAKVRRLWRLAHDPTPVHVSPRRLRRLLSELRDLRTALDDGSVRLEL